MIQITWTTLCVAKGVNKYIENCTGKHGCAWCIKITENRN